MAPSKERLSRRHIAIIVCCCLTSGLPAGMLMNTPSIFYPVIAEDLGVQTVEISAWMAICLLSAAIFQPLMGNVVARFRMRNMMLAGAMVMVCVFLVFSVATQPWMFWLAATMTGLSFAACLSVGPATLTNRWFFKHVGLLLGAFAACSALGGVVFMLIGQAIIDTQGWRAAYVVYALAILFICVPAILVCVKDRPEDCGLQPYGAEGAATLPAEAVGESGASAGAGDAADAARQEAEADVMRRARACMRTPAFALLILAGFLTNVVCQVNGYLPKYIYWVNDQAALGVMSVAFISGVALSSLNQAGSAVGKLTLGAFSDISVKFALWVLCGGGAVGIVFIWLLPATPLMAVGGFVYGFFLASVLVLVPMLVRTVFGSGELYPVLYARVAMAPACGGAVANILWPFIADNLGGFDMVFSLALVAIAVILVSSLVALRLPKKDW